MEWMNWRVKLEVFELVLVEVRAKARLEGVICIGVTLM